MKQMNGSGDLTFFESIILGIVQGLTEFFPVSSDGHLVLAREILNYHRNLLVFDVVLHIGTLGSLIVLFRKECIELLMETWRAAIALGRTRSLKIFKNDSKFRWALYIWITTFVTGVVGLIVEKQISETYESVLTAGLGFLITSAFLFIGWSRRNGKFKAEDFSWWFPLALGLAQAGALLPGVSRSGLTISTALIFGMKRDEAGRFAFIVAIPIIFLASLYECRHLLQNASGEVGIMFAGVLTSFVVGIFAIKGLLLMIRKLSLYPFAIYTAALGVLTLVYLRMAA